MAFVNLLMAVYPVGSIYLSTSSVSPSTVIGGTWTAISGSVLAITGSGYAGSASYGGVKKLALTHFPRSTVRFRTIAAEDNNLIRGSQSGLFSKEIEDWDGNHAALATATWGPDYKTEMLVIDGDNADLIPYHFSVYGWYRVA